MSTTVSGARTKDVTRELRRTGPGRFSADGRLVVFTCPRGVCLARANGTNRSLLVEDTSNTTNLSPVFSPDGTTVFFWRLTHHPGEGFSSSIWAMSVDGTDQIQLTGDELRAFDPEVSPDGETIAFAARAQATPPSCSTCGDATWTDADIYLMSRDGTNVVNLTDDDGRDGDPTFTPDGSRLAYSSDARGKIRSIDLGGGDERLLVGRSDGHLYEPSFSPDGRWLLFEVKRFKRQDIGIARADGSRPKFLVETKRADEYGPVWEPR